MRVRAKILIGIITAVLSMSTDATLVTVTNATVTEKQRVNSVRGACGNFYVGGFKNASIEWMDRSFFVFKLPDMTGRTLVSATLKTYLISRSKTAPDVDLYHVQDLNKESLETADYNAGTATLTIASFVTSSSLLKQYYTADVLNDVLSDYAKDPSDAQYASFRLQLSDETLQGVTDRYYFKTGSSAVAGVTRTELILTFETP